MERRTLETLRSLMYFSNHLLRDACVWSWYDPLALKPPRKSKIAGFENIHPYVLHQVSTMLGVSSYLE